MKEAQEKYNINRILLALWMVIILFTTLGNSLHRFTLGQAIYILNAILIFGAISLLFGFLGLYTASKIKSSDEGKLSKKLTLVSSLILLPSLFIIFIYFAD